MKTIDIDSLDPGYSTEPAVRYKKQRKLTHRQQVELKRTSYVTVNNGGRRTRLGIRPETMRDWRRLERRTHELEVAWRSTSEALWSRLEVLSRSSVATEVVVAIDDDEVMRVSRGEEVGYSVESQSWMLRRLTQDPDCYGKFVFYAQDQGGSEIGRLYRRFNRLLTAHASYKAAFVRAVTDRLKRFADSREEVRNRHRRYFQPAIVVVENEGRRHVFSINEIGHIFSIEGEVFLAKEGTR